MFSCKAGSPSIVASCGGTTPSVRGIQAAGGNIRAATLAHGFRAGCMTCAEAPSRCETKRYNAFTALGDWLPVDASMLTGLPSVITLRTHSSALCALYRKTPPKLHPTRLTLRPVMWCR